jgi:NAD(P)-dependent dehydrogenase (short-subunit alcohol dehydrogenase family)
MGRRTKIMKIIVMTGVSSGIGKVAAERLTERGHRVIAGACDLVSTEAVEVRPLDLNNLDTVRAFAATLNTMQSDTLTLNAGVQGYDLNARTIQGFERTFGVKHLAHYLLARLLLPQMKEGGTLIFTASGTHDPVEKTAVPPPKHADAEWLAYPERDPQLDQRPMLPFIQPFSHRMNSLVDAGRGLADLSDGTSSSQTAIYCSLRKGKPTWPPPSTIAQDDTECARLWRDSATMVGLPP